ncbi:MAG TPA: choice-of-anchor Q domain-containing protein [bacterium]|nr:choice-of-anchor Q domain-containing protein [bacterium]
MKTRALSLVLMMIVAVFIPVAAQADTITVNSLDDDGNGLDGDCNFREALMAAEGNIGLDACDPGGGADEIVFASGLTGTISLASALPSVKESLTVTGPGADVLTIDGGQHDSIFFLNSTTNDQTFTFTGLTLTNGFGSDGGGALYVSVGDTLVVSRCVVTGNSNGGKGRAGGIAVESATLVMTDSTVSDNESVNTGGGIDIFNAGGKAVLRNSTVSGNRVSDVGDGVNVGAGAGGGIRCSGCVLDVVNSTISGNEAVIEGGGISNDGTVRLRNTTVSDNTAGAGAGGVFNEGGANVFLKNSLIAGNEDTSGGAPDCSGVLSSQDFNLIGDTEGCAFVGTTTHNVTDENALLGLLAGNGGPTFTHALLADSPALDAGNPAGCVDENDAPLTTDQRGFERPVGGACDIGALESGGCGDGVVDAARGEECDDGNDDDSDACRNDCTSPPAGTTGGTTGGATAGGDAGGGCSLIR